MKRIIDNRPSSGVLVMNISKSLITCGVYDKNAQLSLLIEYTSKESNADLLHQVKQEINKIQIHKTIIGICDHRFTLLPQNYAALSSVAIEKLFTQAPNEVTQEMQLKNDSVGIYLAKNNTLAILHELFEQPLILNTYLSLLHGYDDRSDKLFVHYNDHHLILTAFKGGRLQYHHGYEVEQIEDALYYIHKAAHTLSIDHIIANDHEELYKKGKSFVKKIGTIEKPNIELYSLYQYAHHQW